VLLLKFHLKLLLYETTSFNDEDGKIVDQIGYAEHCLIDEDGELDSFKVEWIRL